MFKRILLVLLAVGMAGLWLHQPARAGHRWSHSSVNIHTRESGAWDDCAARYDISFDDQDAYRAQEQQTLARSSFSTLRVHDLRNSGVVVHGWDKPDVQVTVCKAVAAASQSEAEGLLRQIKLQVSQGDVTVQGVPDDGDVWIGLLIQVPRGIAMQVSTRNGPLSIQDVEGTVGADSQNGPISLRHCSGTIDVSAQNGPVALKQGRGKVRIDLRNGPLDVELEPQAWQGEGLVAHTENGPLSVKLPQNYRSGVEVDASWHSPFRCRLDACSGAVKDWDNEGRSRSIRLGPSGAPTVVRISTVNGPVSIGATEF
ncbi:MAG TPA: hypothetical protein VLT85_06405 [Terriglobales bacterium]|nr:hypothetical protein [Terriglobales bacterium]